MTSWRTAPMPPGWSATRHRILVRDSFTCYRCGAYATEVDHVKPAHAGGGEEDSNLAAICKDCHRTKTGREAQRARVQRRRPSERHPGMVS